MGVMNKKINLIMGILLLTLIIIVNERTVAAMFTIDGHIDNVSDKIFIYLFDVFVGFSGLFLIWKRESFRIKGIILRCLITILVFIITLEVYARIKYLYDPPLPLGLKFLHQELGAKASEFIHLEKKGRGLKYYDYYLYAIAPYQSQTATFTKYFSARSVPDSYPLGEGAIIVWLFGGSTMQNLETIDKFTIANSLACNLRKSGIKASFLNFGTGGFQSSLESIKFQDLLRRTSFSERPDVVIFYDGVN
ncbi:MAG: hypothetical protein KAV87_33715, partial [Desulfobacteraceae bacterium]|nr:hypothetical protein [Desulfobacteraceae bacterium]